MRLTSGLKYVPVASSYSPPSQKKMILLNRTTPIKDPQKKHNYKQTIIVTVIVNDDYDDARN